MVGRNFTDLVSKLKIDMALKALNKRAKKVLEKNGN